MAVESLTFETYYIAFQCKSFALDIADAQCRNKTRYRVLWLTISNMFQKSASNRMETG